MPKLPPLQPRELLRVLDGLGFKIRSPRTECGVLAARGQQRRRC